jgi:hypothetical protein
MHTLIKGSKKWNCGRSVYITTINAGAGSFLEHPGHHSHRIGLVAGVDRGNGYQEYGSVSHYLENAPQEAKQQIKEIADQYTTVPAKKEFDAWVTQVLKYFNTCYSPDGVDRNITRCKFEKGDPFTIGVDRHLGVMHIRESFPDFKPTKEMFV